MSRALTEIRHEIADTLRPGELVDTGGVAAKVVSVHGTDAAAPVIVEELAPVGAAWLHGQLAIVSRRHVRRVAAQIVSEPGAAS